VSKMRLGVNIGLMACFLLVAADPAWAADKDKAEGGFTVTGTSLHADRSEAEICLTFSAPVTLKDRGRLLAALDVQQDRKKLKLSADQLSLSSTDVCIQNLDHRATYHLVLQKLETAAGDRLARPYTTTFFVPDRKPELSFIENGRSTALPRHVKEQDKKTVKADLLRADMAHVVHSVNVLATHLSLYRVTNRSDFAGAWQQYRMINIAPSESLYFAKEKGQLVFESDLAFGEAPNQDQTLIAPLPEEKGLTPGLYYLAAAPRGKAGQNVTLFAGQWFLVSDLRLASVKLKKGLKVFASYGAGELKASPDVAVSVLAADGTVLGEAKTGADGSAFVALDDETMKRGAFVVGQLASGDADILELGDSQSLSAANLAFTALVKTDQETYRSGTTASVALRAENQQGQPLEVGESALKLLRADRRAYSEYPVSGVKAGLYSLDIPLPVTGRAGAWVLSWTKKDGTQLAEKTIRISPDATFGKIQMDFDRQSLAPDAGLTATVRVTDDAGKPLAFKNGQIIVTSAQPESDSWKAYHFGDSTVEKGVPTKPLAFITNENGVAHVPVDLEGGSDRFQGLKLEASLETGIKSAPVIMPVRNRGDSLIGIKPLPDEAPFAENSMATFDVIAIDMGGKRKAESNLYAVIYEEGRSFDWFPAEGHWDYKQLPSHRRVGGGHLDIPATGESLVRWPVTTGQYMIEITNASGDVLARYPFGVGHEARQARQIRDNRIAFAASDQTLENKQANKVKLTLAKPAMVNVIVSDGQVRHTLHTYMKAGANEIELTPEENWGHKVLVRVEALFVGSSDDVVAEQVMTIHSSVQDLVFKMSPPALAVTGGVFALPVQLLHTQHAVPSFVTLVATPEGRDADGTLKPVHVEKVALDAEGKADIKMALPRFEGTLHFVLYGWNDSQWGETKFSLPAQPALALSGKVPTWVNAGDKIAVPLAISAANPTVTPYSYEVEASQGLVLSGATKGSFKLNKGGKQTLALTLAVGKEATDGFVRVEVKSQSGEPVVQTWPLFVRRPPDIAWEVQSRTLEAGQSVPVPFDGQTVRLGVALIAPMPLPEMHTALQTLVSSEPHSTRDIALWIETMRALNSVARAMELFSEARYEALRSSRLHELQLRQNDDGGFAPLHAGEPSDLLSTAAAVRALSGEAERPAALGADWMASRLQNTWFDESERLDRLVAFESLAKIKKVDLSALRYFSETSRDKQLPPSASAALALALTQGGDEAAAQPWLDRAKKGLADQTHADLTETLRTLRFLAMKDKISVDEMMGLLKKVDVSAASTSMENAALLLAAIEATSQRGAAWQAVVGGSASEKRHGIMPVPLKAQASVTIKNPTSLPLPVTQMMRQDDKGSAKPK